MTRFCECRPRAGATCGPSGTSPSPSQAGVAAVYTPKDYDLTATLTDLVEIVARAAG